MDSKQIVFFGKTDLNTVGAISSEYPAWSMETHLSELKESVARSERQLASGTTLPSELPYLQASLRKDKIRLEEIESSRPKLSVVVENECLKAYKDLSDKIAESLFTRDEMMKGLADPQKEARRMVQPCIEVSPELAKACGVRTIVDGKVSRNDASRIYKILGHYFRENTNIETLRKDSRKR